MQLLRRNKNRFLSEKPETGHTKTGALVRETLALKGSPLAFVEDRRAEREIRNDQAKLVTVDELRQKASLIHEDNLHLKRPKAAEKR